MQILEVPYTHQEMNASVSLKGVCFLKDTRYKRRHKGAPDYVQLPTYGFMSLAKAKELYPDKPAKKVRRNTHQKPVQVRKPAAYRIDKKTVTHRILGYVNAMRGTKRLYLITISFPQGTPDEACFMLLRKWLIRVTTDEKLRDYMRITERQKNGTAHFHITVNQYIDIKRVNRYMRAAMMTSKAEGTLDITHDAIMKYNGVDIAKNRKTRRVINFAKKKAAKALAHYLAKYVTKNDTTFPKLAWHNSRGYTNVITHVQLTSPEFNKTGLQQYLEMERPLIGEWFTFYRWKGQPPDKVTGYLAFVTQTINDLNQIQ